MCSTVRGIKGMAGSLVLIKSNRQNAVNAIGENNKIFLIALFVKYNEK